MNALRLRPLMTYAQPHWAVQLRIALIALSDLAGARTLMREINEIPTRRPDLGTLVGEAQVLRTRLAGERAPSTAAASSLTGAELRLLPMLSTHLQMHEIAAEMYLSPHTIRAQGKSIYRKLGVGSRGQAVARARRPRTRYRCEVSARSGQEVINVTHGVFVAASPSGRAQ